MDARANAVFEQIATADDFALIVASDRARVFDTLVYKGLEIAHVEARRMEAQFRLSDGSTLLMLNDDEAFREKLTVLLIDSGLRVIDRLVLGGAFTPGYLTFAYPAGPEEIAFCWHDLEQVVTVRPHRRGLRQRWLQVRELNVRPLPRQGGPTLPAWFVRLRGLRVPALHLPRWRPPSRLPSRLRRTLARWRRAA